MTPSVREVAAFPRLLRNALLTFFLVGTVALLSYGSYSWQREQRDAIENFQTLSNFLASASQSFFDELGNGLAPLGQLLDRPELLSKPESLRPVVNAFQVRHPQVRAVAVFAPDGRMLLNTAVKPGAPLPDFRADPPYLARLLEDMRSSEPYTVGPPELGKALKLWRFSIRHVVRDADGTPRFLVQAAIPLEKEGTFLHQLPVPPNSYVGLLQANGYQQVRFPVENPARAYGERSPGPVARAILADPGASQGHFAGFSPLVAGEKDRLGAFTKLADRPFYAYVSVPASYVTLRWWRHNVPVLISFLVFFALFVVIAFRVTRRERFHSAELIEQGQRDALTGLPNRGCLNQRLEAIIAGATAERAPFAILFLDLDRFKGINDTLGHAVGDALLSSVARRLQPLLRGRDQLGRFGGDEFLIVLPGSDQAGALVTTRRILDAFTVPFDSAGRSLRITPSIGIALFPEHGVDMETLLKHADTAMYESKRMGRNAYTVYADQMGSRVRERLEMENEIRDALHNGGFRLVYQPIVDMHSSRIVGVEALVRWMLADGRMRSPVEFIQVAEDSGLIIPLGQWVLRTACLQLKQWVDAGFDLRMAVNLSTHQFLDPHLLENVTRTLKETALAPGQLELEITETAAMLNPEESMVILGKLSALGLRIAIDDFGTGYSSLNYLRRIPADTIKIDKSFVDGLAHAQDATIVSAVIALAHALEKETIAEGIETEAQFLQLREMGCDYAQGYWLSQPVTAPILSALLAGSGCLGPALAADGAPPGVTLRDRARRDRAGR